MLKVRVNKKKKAPEIKKTDRVTAMRAGERVELKIVGPNERKVQEVKE